MLIMEWCLTPEQSSTRQGTAGQQLSLHQW